MELKTIYGDVIFALKGAKTICELVTAALAATKSLSGADLRGAYLRGAYLSDADLSGADLSDAYLRGAYLSGKKVHDVRVYTGLYTYEVWAVLFQDGSRWIRMGCLWRSLDRWEEIGIRKSNLSEFPDNGSDRCEERVAAFEFAKAAALRMKLPQVEEAVQA